jgi:essential nuclear protein 1
LSSATFEPEIGGSRNLADLILAKIAEQEAGKADVQEADDEEPTELPPKVVEVYSK